MVRLPYLLLVSCLIAGAAAPPVTPLEACFLSFATVPEGETPRELIQRTYEELLQELGAGRLDPALLQKWADGKKPFELPEEAVRGLDTLPKKLAQYESMLRLKGWNDAGVLGAMTAYLARLAAHGIEVEKKTIVAVENNQTSWSFPTADFTEVPIDIHPTGRWILSPVHTSVRRNQKPHSQGVIFDAEKRVSQSYRTDRGNFRGARFVKNGTAVAFGDEKRSLLVVPFADGKLDWSRAELIGDKSGPPAGQVDQLEYFAFTPNPDIIYAGAPVKEKWTYRFDLKNKTRTNLDIYGFMDAEHPGTGRSLVEWGSVPGTDRLYLLLLTQKELALHEVSVDAEGKLTKVGPSAIWDRNTMDPNVRINHVRYSPDGKNVLVSQRLSVAYLNANRDPVRLEQPNVVVDAFNITEVYAIAMHPNGEEALITVGDRGDSVKVYRVDLKTKKVSLLTIWSGGGTPRFSPDGKTVIFSGAREVKSINYGLLKGEP